MSKDSTALGSEHFAYITAHTTPEDRLLAELRTAAAAAGLPAIHIAAEQAAFLQILLALCKARDVVEVGTLGGYSAIAMARALPPGGKVRTIEFEPKHAEFARAWIARSDVNDRVEVLLGDGRQVLPTLAGDSADAIFIDADKQGYPTYLQQGLRIVRRGGLIMADNALAFGELLDGSSRDASVLAIRKFNDLVAATAGLRAVIVPLGDGCWVGIRQ
ncbi:MAG TPA: O-methyltransferase [Planctomycetota bacterium]|nr:O-methyltransferase [Planctomycetota bacterium]